VAKKISAICVISVKKSAQKSLIFPNFRLKSAHFCEFLVIFCAFLAIFTRFYFAYPTQTIQTNLPNPVFNPKTHIAP